MKVLNIKHYDKDMALVDHNFGTGKSVYIGREMKRYGLSESPLANHNHVTDFGGKHGATLPAYKKDLWKLIKKGDQKVIGLLYLIGTYKLNVVCWCKDKNGNGACHGDIVLNASTWVVEHTKKNMYGTELVFNDRNVEKGIQFNAYHLIDESIDLSNVLP